MPRQSWKGVLRRITDKEKALVFFTDETAKLLGVGREKMTWLNDALETMLALHKPLTENWWLAAIKIHREAPMMIKIWADQEKEAF